MSGLGDGPLSLSEFTEQLPQVLARCQTKHMRKCEPVKRLLQCVGLLFVLVCCVCIYVYVVACFSFLCTAPQPSQS